MSKISLYYGKLNMKTEEIGILCELVKCTIQPSHIVPV